MTALIEEFPGLIRLPKQGEKSALGVAFVCKRTSETTLRPMMIGKGGSSSAESAQTELAATMPFGPSAKKQKTDTNLDAFFGKPKL